MLISVFDIKCIKAGR